MLTLNDLKAGQTALIQEIANPETALQALRIGISAGERIMCVAKIPAGPTVIQKGGMEFALGQDLCREIKVVLP